VDAATGRIEYLPLSRAADGPGRGSLRCGRYRHRCLSPGHHFGVH